jgi:hypothetical protein
MFKHLVMGFGLIVSCSISYADVKLMTNNELDEVAIATQPEALKPVLPEYDSNGQIGGVASALSETNVNLTSVGTEVTTPSALATASGGVAIQLPVAQLNNLIANVLHSLNIPQTAGR